MFSKVILATLAATSLAANAKPAEFYEKEFFEHMTKFNLKFADGKEFMKRLQIFASNLDLFEKHNADKTQTFQMGVNQFTHLTFDEFKDAVHIGGTRIPNLRRNPHGPMHVAKEGEKLASELNWVTKGAVTPVKNQGNCGSCWSFSATGAMEGGRWVAGHGLTSLSEQQLVSCDTVDGGCNGGWMDDAFNFALGNGGICSEESYPYTSGTTGKSGSCSSGCSAVDNTKPSGWTDVDGTKNGEANLMSAINVSPVAVAIQANQIAFQTYKGGVLTGTCGDRLDHGVLAVGYGTENGVDYWLVKNSWGDSWGEAGYIKIARADNKCGIQDAASYVSF